MRQYVCKPCKLQFNRKGGAEKCPECGSAQLREVHLPRGEAEHWKEEDVIEDAHKSASEQAARRR